MKKVVLPSFLKKQMVNYLAVDLAEQLLECPSERDINAIEEALLGYQYILNGR